VFFDMSMSLPDSLFDKARDAHFDLYKAFRQYIFEYIITQSGASVEKLKIDKPKINWQIFSMGSQVRDFGTLRDNGFCKTLINNVPATRPDTALPLCFPDSVPLWTIPEYHIPLIIKKIQDGIERQISYNSEIPPNLTGIDDIEKIPCIATIMKGLDAGRYYGASAIVLMGKELGLKLAEIEPLVIGYLNSCTGLNQSEIDLRRDNSLHLLESEKRFSCLWIRENLKGICPGRCLITENRTPEYPKNAFEYEPENIVYNAEQQEERRLNINQLPPDHFISQYVKWGGSVTDAYLEYHVGCATWLLSSLVRRKVVLRLRQEKIYPNLWFQLLGNSTTSRKSTAVNKARTMFEAVVECDLPNQDYSIEGYLESLSLNSIQINVRDESSGLMAKYHKKYNDGIFDLECALYDNQNVEKVLASGKNKTPKIFTVKNPYITKLYATTPDKLAVTMTLEDFLCGYGYRWLYNYPKYRHARKALEMEAEEDTRAWANIASRIRTLNAFFLKLDKELELTASPEVMAHFDKYCVELEKTAEESNNDILNSIIGRSQVHILKIAMLIELGKAQPSTTINIDSIEIAADWVINYYIPSIFETVGRLEEDIKNNKIEKVISIMRRRGGEVTHTRLLQDAHLVSREFNECISTMIESACIVRTKEKPTTYKLTTQRNPIKNSTISKISKANSIAHGDNINANSANSLHVTSASRTKTVCYTANYANSANCAISASCDKSDSCDNPVTELPELPKLPGTQLSSTHRGINEIPGKTGNLGNPVKTCGICGNPLNGNSEQGPAGLGGIHPACKFTPVRIKALVDLPRFTGIDLQNYSLTKGEIKELPWINARVLLVRKAVEEVST
jgi:predicted transcriptional regulator